MTAELKIDQVISAVVKKQQGINFGLPMDKAANLAVYMDCDYYTECKREISGQVSPGAWEFSNARTLLGYPVWVVSPRLDKHGKQVRHPPFVVVNLGET